MSVLLTVLLLKAGRRQNIRDASRDEGYCREPREVRGSQAKSAHAPYTDTPSQHFPLKPRGETEVNTPSNICASPASFLQPGWFTHIGKANIRKRHMEAMDPTSSRRRALREAGVAVIYFIMPGGAAGGDYWSDIQT